MSRRKSAGYTPVEGCDSCAEELTPHECGKSKRPCGHHCNCSWSQDVCCWCGAETDDEGNFPNTADAAKRLLGKR